MSNTPATSPSHQTTNVFQMSALLETFRPEPEGSHERSWCGARHRGDGEEADIGDPIERKGLPAPAVEHPARQRGPGQAPQGSHPGEGKRLPGRQFHRE